MSQLPFDEDPPEPRPTAPPPSPPVDAERHARGSAGTPGATPLGGRIGILVTRGRTVGARGSARFRTIWRSTTLRMRVGVGITVAVVLSIWLAPSVPRAAYSFAYEVKDHLGVRLVEGHTEIIRRAATESQVDPLLVAAIMFAESRGRVGAVSSANALGLMQLSRGAASDAARRLKLTEEPTKKQLTTDAELNVRLGAAHLRWLLEHRGEWNMEAVLVSYNAGRARLFQWIEKAGSWEAWVARQEDLIARGKPNNGSLTYARQVLALREEFAERGVIAPSALAPLPD